MLGDDAQPAATDGHRDRVPTGPRHAAPRKSLLTKLHVPAGKAVALAAMPTAVLMGMGFTPHLAQADDLPKSPFKPGPCVTQSDSSSAAGKDGAKDTPQPHPSAGEADKGGADSASGKGDPTPDPTTSEPSLTGTVTGLLPKPGSTSGSSPNAPQPTATTAPGPTPTPSTAASGNPLDPLGLGGLLNGLLGGGGGGTPTPTPTPTGQAPAPTPSTTVAPTPDPVASAPGTGAKPPAGAPASSAGKTVEDAVGGATDTVRKAAKGLTDAAGKATGTSPSAFPTDGSQSYPCPTYDAKALADAKTEAGIPLLPDQPWTLKSSKLSLHGLNYEGIVQVRTWSGTVKDVMKFTATGVDIADMWQIVDAPDGGHTWVKARAGSTSTIRNGTVTMYTESLSGNLLGLIPITFTPKAPPPLTLPELFFTDVTVVQAGQFGGDLHVPGMQVLPGQS